MAIIFEDDFNTNASSLDSTKWSVFGTSGTTTLIRSDGYAWASTPNASAAYVRALSTMDSRADSELKILVTRSSATTAPVWVVGINGSGSSSSLGTTFGFAMTNGYRLYAKHTAPTLEKSLNGSRTTIGTLPLPVAGKYWVRLQKSGSVIRVKMWGQLATEPATWNIEYTDPSPVGAGVAFFGAHSGGGTTNTQFDDVAVDDLVADVPVPVTFNATPATASATLVGPSFGVSSPVSVQATAATASAQAPNASVSTQKSKTVTATPLQASALSVDPTWSLTTNYATDFGEYALGTPVGWTKQTARVFSVVESAGTYSGKRLYHGGTSTDREIIMTLNEVKPTAEGDSLVRFVGNGGIAFGVVASTTAFYARVMTDTTNKSIGLYKYNNATFVETQIAAVPKTITGAVWLRVNVTDGVVRVRAWANGASEPSTWDIEVATTVPVGLWGAYGFVNKNFGMDYYAVNTNDGEVAQSYSLGKEIDAVAATATANIVQPVVRAGTSVEVLAAPAAATATAVESLVKTTSTITIEAGVATASAEALEALVYSPDVTIEISTFEASAFMPEATGVGGHDESVTVDVMTASAEMTEPEFSNVTEVSIAAVAMTAAATTPRAVDAIGDGTNVDVRITLYTETDDPFIKIISKDLRQYTSASLIGAKWFRFGQDVAAPLRNYALTTSTFQGDWAGTPEFGVRDEWNRKATHFDNDAYAILELNLTAFDRRMQWSALSWEMVFRTTDANGPLFSSDLPDVSIPAYREFFTGLEIKDGRVATISKTVTNLSTTDNSYTVSGERVDDGNWHHVLVTIGNRGVEVFIDGVSRLVRNKGRLNFSVPDEALSVERVGANSGQTDYFNGDVLTFVQYPFQLPREAGNRHYYAYVLATVISPEPLEAIAGAGDGNKGRGNRLRALALYSLGDAGYHHFGTEPNWTGQRLSFATSTGNDPNRPFEFGPYTVYPRKMNMTRDEYDFSPHLFTMDSVTDLDDFDMFYFADLPEPNMVYNDVDTTGRTYNLQPEYENFIASVRRAVDTGISLWCPQPQLAADLGLIDRLDVHSYLKQGHDTKSYVEDDPKWKSGFGGGGGDKTYYQDTHYLNQYRVTAQLEGFTDLPGFIIDDVVYWQNLGNPFSLRPDYIKWKVLDRMDGLQLGDEIYMPTDLAWPGGGDRRDEHIRHKIWSVPAGAYRGTAVAKEQPTVNMNDNVNVVNPYGDNALTIVVQPGDNVGGRPIGGKVLVDFMSGYNPGISWTLTEQPFVVKQVPPYGPLSDPNRDLFDGYDYDGRRLNAYFEMRTGSRFVGIGNPGDAQNTYTQKTFEVPFYSEAEKYAIQFLPSVPWLERGLRWLGVKNELNEGDVRVFAARSEASAAAVQPTINVQKHNAVRVAPAVALAQIVQPEGIADPDVTVTTLPMTAVATMLGLAMVISPSPMTAEASMPEPTSRGTGQDYILSIRSYTNATVYLKEDAR